MRKNRSKPPAIVPVRRVRSDAARAVDALANHLRNVARHLQAAGDAGIPNKVGQSLALAKSQAVSAIEVLDDLQPRTKNPGQRKQVAYVAAVCLAARWAVLGAEQSFDQAAVSPYAAEAFNSMSRALKAGAEEVRSHG